MSLTPGTRVGAYEILGSLGAGGMGEVFRARDPRLGRDVAIKVLHGGTANDPDRRRRFERPLLDHYHAALLAHGVQGYDRAALAEDYRRSVLMQLLMPVLQWSAGIPPWVWWSHLERISAAVDDLDCHPLLT